MQIKRAFDSCGVKQEAEFEAYITLFLTKVRIPNFMQTYSAAARNKLDTEEKKPLELNRVDGEERDKIRRVIYFSLCLIFDILT